MKARTQKKLIGIVKRHADGFGFFIPDNKTESDAYITKPDMRGLMTRDRVEVLIKPEPGGNRFRAKIVKVLQRNFDQIVGQVYFLKDKTPILADSSHSWGCLLYTSPSPRDQRGSRMPSSA